ncbi:hypothetical protein RFI_05251 [Reticulomyxa filosa]|uniref:Glycosyltransferase family 92 protein n=1 Tax=Reticulomyxa filosa TaxID=46433 RepID=X6P185_RETFI|nr:hypothetical protein RFI_05251 [Reticulomyxa filosa]|eukprot:ETO31868.1 hypothetical protein RFI_05251 [Reticulomyxa filosa]
MSRKIRTQNPQQVHKKDYVVVICDLLDNEVLYYFQSQSVEILDEYLGNVSRLQQQILSSHSYTSVGVKIFDPRPILYAYNNRSNVSSEDRKNADILPSAIVPVCSTSQINHNVKTGTYSIFRHDPPQIGFNLVRIPSDENRAIVQNIAHIRRHAKHMYFFFFFVHPKGDRFGQLNQLLEQWLEFHLHNQQFDHFYIYDHMHNRDAEHDTVIYDTIAPYIARNQVTYVRWAVSGVVRWTHDFLYYQYAQQNSCIRRFGFESRWMTLIDIDEWLFVNPWYNVMHHINVWKDNDNRMAQRINSSAASDTLKLSQQFHSGSVKQLVQWISLSPHRNWIYFRRHIGVTCTYRHQNCKLPSKSDFDWNSPLIDMTYEQLTQPLEEFWFVKPQYTHDFGKKKWDCNNEYELFLERHQCIIERNLFGKYLLDPLMAHVVWLHFVDTLNEHFQLYPYSGHSKYWVGVAKWKQLKKLDIKTEWVFQDKTLEDSIYAVHTPGHHSCFSMMYDDYRYNFTQTYGLQMPFINLHIAKFKKHWATISGKHQSHRPVKALTGTMLKLLFLFLGESVFYVLLCSGRGKELILCKLYSENLDPRLSVSNQKSDQPLFNALYFQIFFNICELQVFYCLCYLKTRDNKECLFQKHEKFICNVPPQREINTTQQTN